MSVNSKMTAIADQVRTLQGGTGKLGLDAMATQVGAANSTVTAQASLISQIASALEGKAAGGGELQHATGTATGSGDTTFTVTGLTFPPLFLIVTAPVNDAYSGIEAAIGTSNLVHAFGWDANGIGYGTAGTFAPVDDGCTLSFTSVTSTGIKFYKQVTYTWCAYGL